MDAAELMEWIAFFQTQDQETADKLKIEIQKDASAIDRSRQMRAFLGTIRAKK